MLVPAHRVEGSRPSYSIRQLALPAPQRTAIALCATRAAASPQSHSLLALLPPFRCPDDGPATRVTRNLIVSHRQGACKLRENYVTIGASQSYEYAGTVTRD